MTKRFDLLATLTTDPVLRLTGGGKIAFANDAALALFTSGGVKRLNGRMLLEVTHSRALLDVVESARSVKSIRQGEVRLSVGQERVFLARAVALPTGGTMLLLADRTELAHLRTVRTEFVVNVSHELRTPLAGIRAMAETLLDGAMHNPEFAEKFLGNIIREVDRLVRLSEDLSQLTKAELVEPLCERFDLCDLLDEVTERLAGYAAKRDIVLNVPEEQAPIEIDADRGELDQVFFNLIDNAIKYTPAGGTVTLTIDLDGAQVTVSIADTGIGILKEDLPRVFERFWRADRARKFPAEGGTATGGTGLGLSIVKHIVEAHGGTIRAESELGRGSKFTVTLPTKAPEKYE